MIQEFVDRFMENKENLRKKYMEKRPDSYDDIVRDVVEMVRDPEDGYGEPDPKKITIIDHGDWQGTRLYIIPSDSYQPSTYWRIFVDYGSCSGCDAFEAIREYGETPSAGEVDGYVTLALHMVQNMKEV